MRLSTLLGSYTAVPDYCDHMLSGLALDSRSIQAQQLFIALSGTQTNGLAYLNQAIERGAVAAIYDPLISRPGSQSIPLIPIPNLAEKVGQLAAKFYDYPASKLTMLGVTGTNGKTSCTHYLAQCLTHYQIKCGMIGTLGYGFPHHLANVGLTTPDAVSLHRIIAELVDQRAQAIAMEVSSHSLAQHRINGIDFQIGLFTNLTQDHLDYHQTMSNYARAKKSFFLAHRLQDIVFNYDDPYGRLWFDELSQLRPVYRYSLQAQTNFSMGVFAKSYQLLPTAIHAHVVSPWGEGELYLPLMGLFNLSNGLACLTALCLLGIDFEAVLGLLTQVEAVPGRMQVLGGEHLPRVIIDYSHTPDALEKVLSTLRPMTTGNLICIFGCGGDRDQAKRPLMASIAERFADQIIVTNDNPRHEDPAAISKDILQGFNQPQAVQVILDRSLAIKNGIQCASIEDCVLIAGKGAEVYQQIGDNKFPFNDREVAQRVLSEREKSNATFVE